MRAAGPTRIGAISPSWAASTTPSIEIRSQGWATAVVTGGSCCAACTSRSYRSRGPLASVSICLPHPLPALRRLVPADLRGRTGEHCLDALEPPAALFREGAARSEHPTHQRQRLIALPAIVGQQFRQCRDRPLWIQQEDQILLLDDL